MYIEYPSIKQSVVPNVKSNDRTIMQSSTQTVCVNYRLENVVSSTTEMAIKQSLYLLTITIYLSLIFLTDRLSVSCLLHDTSYLLLFFFSREKVHGGGMYARRSYYIQQPVCAFFT